MRVRNFLSWGMNRLKIVKEKVLFRLDIFWESDIMLIYLFGSYIMFLFVDFCFFVRKEMFNVFIFIFSLLVVVINGSLKCNIKYKCKKSVEIIIDFYF